MFRQIDQSQCQCSIFGNQRTTPLAPFRPRESLKQPKRSLKRNSCSGRKSRGTMGSIESQGVRKGTLHKNVIRLIPHHNQENNYYNHVSTQVKAYPQQRNTSPHPPICSQYQINGRISYASPSIVRQCPAKPCSYSVETTAAGSLLQPKQSVNQPRNRESSVEQESALDGLTQRPRQTESIYEEESTPSQEEHSRVLISCQKLMENKGVLEKEARIQLFDFKEASLPLQGFTYRSRVFDKVRVSGPIPRGA